jgi:hypothetical protein
MESPETQKRRRTKRMQRDAAAVSIVRGGRSVSSFAERQQLAEGAPVSGMPFCGFAPVEEQVPSCEN